MALLLGPLTALWGRVVPYVLAAAAVAAALAGFYIAAKRAGAASERARQITRTLEVKDAQQIAAAAAPRGRDAVARRLRDGGF